MIRSNEAILLLQTSAPTFYKRVDKESIELVHKIENNRKASYIHDNDLDRLAFAMNKTLLNKQSKEKTIEPESSEQKTNEWGDEKKLLELLEAKNKNILLASKVEEYKGYSELYKEQMELAQKKNEIMTNEKVGLMTEVLKVKIRLSTFKVMFYWLLLIMAMVITLSSFGILSIN